MHCGQTRLLIDRDTQGHTIKRSDNWALQVHVQEHTKRSVRGPDHLAPVIGVMIRSLDGEPTRPTRAIGVVVLPLQTGEQHMGKVPAVRSNRMRNCFWTLEIKGALTYIHTVLPGTEGRGAPSPEHAQCQAYAICCPIRVKLVRCPPINNEEGSQCFIRRGHLRMPALAIGGGRLGRLGGAGSGPVGG